MKKKWLFLLAFVGLCGVSQSAVVLSNIGEAFDSGRTFTPIPGQETFSGLGFKTGSSGGTIDALSFSLLAGNTPSPFPTLTFSVFLYELDGGTHLPVAGPLATDAGLSATFVGSGTFLQETFAYAAGDLTGIAAVQLAANTEYAIVLGNNNANDEYYWATQDAPVSYTFNDGYSWVGNVNSSDNGTSWNALETTSGYIGSISVTSGGSAVPEPASGLMVVAGSLLIITFRRRLRVAEL